MTDYHYDFIYEKDGEEIILRPNKAKGLKFIKKVARTYLCSKCNGSHQFKSKKGQEHIGFRK